MDRRKWLTAQAGTSFGNATPNTFASQVVQRDVGISIKRILAAGLRLGPELRGAGGIAGEDEEVERPTLDAASHDRSRGSEEAALGKSAMKPGCW
jgi:hypothetical protein